jgi:hypothetical protein
MKAHFAIAALLTCFGAALTIDASAQGRRDFPITVRPATLADGIEELAGHSVIVPYARVVGIINPRVIVVDTATRLRPILGNRDRVVVIVQPGAVNIPRAAVVGATVKVIGVARTVLGVQVTREVPWPQELAPNVVERLEIRAAIVASSVQTADGVELTSSASAP